MQTTRFPFPLLFPLFFFNLSFVSWFTSEGKISKNLGNDRNAEYHFSHAFFVTFTRFHYRARNNRQDLIIGQFHLNLERVEEFEGLRWCARARISESARFNSKRGGGSIPPWRGEGDEF